MQAFFFPFMILPMKWQEAEILFPLQLPPCQFCIWLTVSLNHSVSMGHCTETSLLNRYSVIVVPESETEKWVTLRYL